MSDIAAKAGTSVGVVSVTLNGAKSKTLRVSASTRERVLEVAKELGYQRDSRASALATGRNNVLGLMLPNASSYTESDPFYSLVTSGITAGAAHLGYNLMLYTTVAEDEGATAVKKIDRRIDGLILVAPSPESTLQEECRRRGIPTVAITDLVEKSPLTVNSSDYEGARLATQHLLDLGHRRIAHLYGNPNFATTQPRIQAYRDTLDVAGIALDPHLIAPGGFSRSTGRRSTEKLISLTEDLRPTAIFAANDLSAHGAIDAILAAGLEVPNDISVVGYDDTWYASVTTPPLTSVSMNVAGLGRCAAETLIAHVEGRLTDRHPVLPVSLTIRQSSGPVRVELTTR